MDWNALINGLVGSGPVAIVLAYAWYRAEQRADALMRSYLQDSRANIEVLEGVKSALGSVLEEVKR